MSRVITFSTKFPSHHPKAGQPTFFVEKIWESIYLEYITWPGFFKLAEQFDINQHNIYKAKHHTIRTGKRWKTGDKFSPRVWSGKPYQSKQIIIGPDIEIKKVFDFEIEPLIMQNVNVGDKYIFVKINGQNVWCNASIPDNGIIDRLSENDGLSAEDLKAWFKWGQPFSGQIICWNEQLDYVTGRICA